MSNSTPHPTEAKTAGALSNGISGEDSPELDAIWETSASAKQIRALGDVDVGIHKLLKLAASIMRLLALPDPDVVPPAGVPGATEEDVTGDEDAQMIYKEATETGEERAELVVERVGRYYDTLDAIQDALRRGLYNLRVQKMSSASITAPHSDFVPPALGLGPSRAASATTAALDERETDKQGLQETRVEKAAWLGLVATLEKMKAMHSRRAEEGNRSPSAESMESSSSS